MYHIKHTVHPRQPSLTIPGEVDNAGLANQMILRNKPPVATVLTVVPVVPHHNEVVHLDRVSVGLLTIDDERLSVKPETVLLISLQNILKIGRASCRERV